MASLFICIAILPHKFFRQQLLMAQSAECIHLNWIVTCKLFLCSVTGSAMGQSQAGGDPKHLRPQSMDTTCSSASGAGMPPGLREHFLKWTAAPGSISSCINKMVTISCVAFVSFQNSYSILENSCSFMFLATWNHRMLFGITMACEVGA